MEDNEFNIEENTNQNNEDVTYRNKKKRRKEKKKKSKFKKILLLLFIIFIVIIGIVFINYNNTIRHYVETKTNLVINSNNVTARLKHDVIMKDNIIYLSMEDVKNFFDKYINVEDDINKIITTGDIATAEIGFNEGENIKINGVNSKVKACAIKEDDIIYLPLSEMLNVYNITTNYIEETNIITVDSINKELKEATLNKNCILREKRRSILSDALEELKKGDKVYIASGDNKGWTRVRTLNGKVGYIKTKNLSDQKIIQEAYSFYNQNISDEKINMFWDYFSEYSSAPNRTGEKIEGVNVVSPTFFYLDKNGKLQENIGTEGKEYIEWAKSQGMQIWPRVSNDLAGMDITSKILNNYSARQELILNLVEKCMIYEFDGINIDFENMYQDDKDAFSKFIIEMAPIMKDSGSLVLSVDVTAPDGSPNWSLCYDRNVLGDVADYLIFMAYDQYGSSSTTAGTTAGYNWVENNIKKFLNNEAVPANKIILGIPFYTRIWTQTSEKVVSRTVDMKDVNTYIPSGVEKKWDDTLKQYYVEFTDGNVTKKMWIEDVESIKAKCSLVNKYNLAGVAAWEKDRENNNVWDEIDKALKNK